MPTDLTPYISIGVPIFISLIGAIASYKVQVNRIDMLFSTLKEAKDEIKELKAELQTVRERAVKCETILKEREALAKRKSPLSLTERGTNLLKNSKGDRFIDENLEELKKLIDDEAPPTAYDVQELSQKTIASFKDDPRFIPLKDYLYKEGEDINDLVFVMGIYLRDKVLMANGMKIEDIDKHDPAIKK